MYTFCFKRKFRRAIIALIWSVTAASCLVVVPMVAVATPSAPTGYFQPSSMIHDTSLLLAATKMKGESYKVPFSTKDFEKDQVVRVLDANTIKLQKNGLVRLAGVRMPNPGSGNFQFPECLSYTPAYKLRQLIPSKTNVLVKIAAGNSKTPSTILLRSEDSLLINRELVRTGFGKVQAISTSSLQGYLDVDELQSLQEQAKEKGIGIYQRCDGPSEVSSVPEAQFEPLEMTMETEWGADGGKLVTRPKDGPVVPPDNPGDIRGCSDFKTYEDALRWYETFFPYYGDVAKLDRDGDGVPCPGLPHTKVAEKYRMKVPTKSGLPNGKME